METPTMTEVIDDGAKSDKRGRRLRSPEGVKELLREYDESGLTQAAFARRAGIKYPTFASWIRARRGRSSELGHVRFAQVQLPVRRVSDGELSVVLPDGLVVRGADAHALAALVKALRN